VALVIPAFNEGKVVKKVVRDLAKVFRTSGYDFQIIVVDDGSKDNTADQARQGGAHVINHILNTGTGGATATGLSYAQQHGFDIATTCDADGQHDPRDVLKGVKLIAKGEADLLIGSRLVDKHGMSKIRFLGNTGLSWITNLLFRIKITDSQSGLRVFSKQALVQLRWRTSGYEFCSEMLWRAKQLGLQIDEFPIKSIYTEYSNGKGQNSWNGVNIVKSLMRQRIVELFE